MTQSTELRCEAGKLLAVLRGASSVEISCTDRRCGKAPGVVVRHVFDVHSGKLLRTDRYREPAATKGM